MPEINCVQTFSGERFFTCSTDLPALGCFRNGRILRYKNPAELAAEILWLGNEYGGLPWNEEVVFTEPAKKWYHCLFLTRRPIPMSPKEKEIFLKKWNELIVAHGLKN